MSDLLGKTSLCAPLVEKIKNPCQRSTNSRAILTASNANPSAFSSLRRERSSPAFIPSAPSKGVSQRRGQRSSSSASTDLLNPSPTVNGDTGPFPVDHNNTVLDVPMEPHQSGDLSAGVRHQRTHSPGPVDARPPQEVSLKQQEVLDNSSACEGRKREKYRVQFDNIPRADSEDTSACTGATMQPLDTSNNPPQRGSTLVESSSEEEHFKSKKNISSTSNLVKSRERSHGYQGSHLLPRPPILPGIVGRQETDSALLHLQNSFSKTAAHRNFNSSITYAAVNLNDNLVSGKKHKFFGINSCYLHG